MAYIDHIICPKCMKEKKVSRSAGFSGPDICAECSAEESTRKEREWKAAKEGLSVVERLRDIEDFIYHHQQNHPQNMVRF